jgi:DNA-binding GntR family transcriptional regulator
LARNSMHLVPESSAQMKPIKVKSAPQAAAEAIREAITVGTLKPGQRLIEHKLAAHLGIGHPTLREALKELEYQGFLHKIPAKGTYINTFDRNQCRELLEMRMCLELLAIERAALRLTPEIKKDLEGLVKGMRIAGKTFDTAKFRTCDADFHRKISALANNRRLAKTLEGIMSQMLVFGTLGSNSNSRKEMVAGADQHERILAGLATRDPGIARRVFITEILRHWNENYKVGLKEADITSPVLLMES